MKNNKEKQNSRDIYEENQELMKELEKTQEKIETQEALCQNLEKENQKLKMFQNFASVFNKTQTNKDSAVISQIISDLEAISDLLASEVKEIGKLRKEKSDLTKKIEIADLELGQFKTPPPMQEPPRKLIRDRSYKDVSSKFA